MFIFKHPFTCIIAGPTQSGKTYFLRDLIFYKDVMINPPPSKILWCYGQNTQDLQDLPPYVGIHEGLPKCLEDIKKEGFDLIVLDDLMTESGKNHFIQNVFTKGSHHLNTSVILVVQNLFYQDKVMRNINLNAAYLIIFKNPRDSSQIDYLSNQIFRGKNRLTYLREAYNQATQEPHSYLVLDLTQDTPENMRVISDITFWGRGLLLCSRKMVRRKKRDHQRNCDFCKKHISERINHYMKELQILAKSNSKKRRISILKKANPCFIRILGECALNVLKGNIHLNSGDLKKLKRHARSLLILVKKNKEPYNQARKCLEKTGGFLRIILPAIISAITGIAGSAISKAIGIGDG